MSDLLSAASLLMTVTAILYGLWHDELTAGLSIKAGRPEDNTPKRKKIRRLALSKALPLAGISLATALIFVPDAIRLSVHTIQIWLAGGREMNAYNAVSTAYCMVVVISTLLAFYTCTLAFKLVKLWLSIRIR